MRVNSKCAHKLRPPLNRMGRSAAGLPRPSYRDEGPDNRVDSVYGEELLSVQPILVMADRQNAGVRGSIVNFDRNGNNVGDDQFRSRHVGRTRTPPPNFQEGPQGPSSAIAA
jgi:hypothetical protein